LGLGVDIKFSFHNLVSANRGQTHASKSPSRHNITAIHERHMKNITVLLYWIVIQLTPMLAFSQKAFISFGGELALPGSASGLSMNAGTGFGGSFRVESSWGKHVSGMASISYLIFAQSHPFSSTPSTTSKVKAIPIQVGLKYYFQKRTESSKGFFLSAEFGIMPTTTHFTYAANPDYDFKETGISAAPGLGYLLGNFESSFRLQYNLTASGYDIYYFNFRLAYAFRKSKEKSSTDR
jgi:hypothetical protein